MALHCKELPISTNSPVLTASGPFARRKIGCEGIFGNEILVIFL